MADHGEPIELPLSSYTSMNAADDFDNLNSLSIDGNLLIDASQLLIGPMISEGTYSFVYEGMYKKHPVAIKVLSPDSSPSELHRKFSREVSILSRINHENIIKFIGVVLVPRMMIITELMKGGTLQKFLSSLRPNYVDLRTSMFFALEISRGMEYLHQNRIIHRDLKPSNLLLTEDKQNLKIADFGSAREMSDGDMTVEVGTYRWMAPEMFNIDGLHSEQMKHYDHKVDVYSFSMVLWELLANQTPFKGRNSILVAYGASMNQRPSIENIPDQIAPFLEVCWAQNPEDRPEFHQITKYLEDFLRKMTITSPSPPQLLDEEYYNSTKKDEKEASGVDFLVPFRKRPNKIFKRLSLRILHRFGGCF